MSIPLEDFASQETVWDFDVSMVPGIPNLTTPELRPIRSIAESPLAATAQLRPYGYSEWCAGWAHILAQ